MHSVHRKQFDAVSVQVHVQCLVLHILSASCPVKDVLFEWGPRHLRDMSCAAKAGR